MKEKKLRRQETELLIRKHSVPAMYRACISASIALGKSFLLHTIGLTLATEFLIHHSPAEINE